MIFKSTKTKMTNDILMKTEDLYGCEVPQNVNYHSRAHQTSKHPGSKNADSDAAGLAQAV